MKLIGYVAQNLTLDTSASRTVRLRNVTDEALRRITAANLASLKQIIKWNVKHGIFYYRITSNLIPYASHPVNKIDWPNEFQYEFAQIGKLIADNKIIVTMHPGQFTVLSSPNPAFVDRAIAEIEYHNTVLDLLNTTTEAKIVIHLGGGYGDKNAAIKRFVENHKKMSLPARQKLVIENDDVTYNVSDCLKAYENSGLPIVFDTLHHQVNPNDDPPGEALEKCLSTWNSCPEVHYSDQAPGKPKGAHSTGINLENFIDFYNKTRHLKFRIMLETKDKEQSVFRIMKALKREQIIKGCWVKYYSWINYHQ